MRKWIIGISSLVLAGAAAFLLLLSLGQGAGEETTPTQTTAAQTLATTVATTAPPETTAATEPPYIPIAPPDMSRSTARQVFVYDVDKGRLLYTLGDQNARIEPASLTKLFTAYVAMQYLEPGDMVTVGQEAGWIGEGSSIAAVSQGCRLSAGMILQGMLMQSGNDAAYAIAVAAGRAIGKDADLDVHTAYGLFIDEMNRQLEALGLTGTHFTTPDGYHDDDHYTTAAELLEIAKLALSQPLIMEYCGIASAAVRYDSGQEYTWKNTNWLLQEASEYYCPEATGLKTGATSQAGKCLIASFDTGETTLLIGVLGCAELEQRFADALLLFEHYR